MQLQLMSAISRWLDREGECCIQVRGQDPSVLTC
jgi:hypothetical protein